MQEQPETPGSVRYQFEIPTESWDAWKDTVPRRKTLDERIRELLRADAEGRVQEESDT